MNLSNSSSMVALAGLLNDLSILPKRANLVSNNAEEFIFTEIKNSSFQL